MYCIDAGSIYCPCHLAETHDCILCSQLSGEEFCQCKDWCGVCIYEKYISNGKKPTKLRKTYMATVFKKEKTEDSLYILTLKAPESLVKELVYPGSFIFLKNIKLPTYYNVPISIMEADMYKSTIKVAIKENGIKTKNILKLNANEKISARGPFYNGIMGLSNIKKAKNGTSLIIARGIGIAPSINVIKKLSSNNNKIISILDTEFKDNFGKQYFDQCNSEIINSSILYNGELTENFKSTLSKIISENNINVIYCGGPDILIYKILKFIDKSINFSCCNNAKMNCGEGICASCTKHYKNDVVKRLCKVQMDPRDLFKDRRFI
ncbi:sulfide/dihydroorotate dehydrogenase-like FAD/NAD-binding protein [Clostridium tyrobutyricum]|jgi:NAD(P)H-flavin reductase|uniref:Electron transfer subunit protein n=1 Tax=Clostridium tyrobutyricum DIVETGP TaxID=1408889 RepID=W6N8H0_CLOTY|nr:sulfide/dihydroorotate dehydrogenase-like FAD/NAD-binding protein [Clostridium tyrobutyricum]AND85773.1 hypothetical protein CTK_C25270 [Clostridium tyrobutyricum]ANP70290.1 hypothetical protein BA182_11570 [Clostridium tyrobutyricum]MBR9648024.1 sulfide/dihydroorotate dehydrogenase-like FAD/NAD-binding protein [Clostridium tyrobutyricum]MBV4417600.1 sulfide/dihydroorotate dehydrogenase-like FAD/NAD-binding protein [Clostridium tyrobutyricum]MBV4421234.1 sulfide/dihydroorotate dehydrogenase